MFLPPEQKQQMKRKKTTGTVLPTELTISSAGGEITLFLSVTLDDGITLTDNAPQKWALEFPGNNPPNYHFKHLSMLTWMCDSCGLKFKFCLWLGCYMHFLFLNISPANLNSQLCTFWTSNKLIFPL
jgi:hypothetical protein